MSALGAQSKRLSATISSGAPAVTDNVLLVGWYKKNSTDPGSGDNLARLGAATEVSHLILFCANSTGYKMRTAAHWRSSGGSASTAGQTGVVTQDTWRLTAGYLAADFSGSVPVANYDVGTLVSTTNTSNASATEALTELVFGDGPAFSAFTFWNGRYAEMACFIVTGTTMRDAVLAACETMTADAAAAATGATLVFYYPLAGDATAHTGPALTNTGTVTFDAGDHPSLSGGGGPDPEPSTPPGPITFSGVLHSAIHGGRIARAPVHAPIRSQHQIILPPGFKRAA